jgi:threonine dehydratase
MIASRHPGLGGLFVHPVQDPLVMAGNGTIGLEILEDLPDVDAIVIPFGGGGLAGGIASAVRALKPDTRLYASEITTGAPLSASWEAGELTDVEYTPSFVDGIGSRYVLPEMWQIARKLLDGVLTTDLPAAADAVRLLVERNRVVAEGASATAVAVALAGKAGTGKVACIVSGGNIDNKKLGMILEGQVP